MNNQPKIQDLKTTAYRKYQVSNTKQLKREYKEAVRNLDLRRKFSWFAILAYFTENCIDTDNTELYQSLQRVGRVMGDSVDEVDTQWRKLQAEARELAYSPGYLNSLK